jgi:hypothetical protein
VTRHSHPDQGSEYQAVVIPIMTQHNAMLQRNLLYIDTNATLASAAKLRGGGPPTTSIL